MCVSRTNMRWTPKRKWEKLSKFTATIVNTRIIDHIDMKLTIPPGFYRCWKNALQAAAGRVQDSRAALVAGITLAGTAIGAHAQNLNGTLDSSFYGSPLYVQTINTGFGDSAGGSDASGSELDAVYYKVSGGNLYLFIAGCFQNNGNHVNVFVAGGAAGQKTLAAPTTGTLKAMNGSVFTNGFQATWALDMNDYQGTLYSEEYTLTGTASGGYVGSLAQSSSGIFAGSDGGVASLYLNNTLASTMGTSGQALSGSGSGANTTTGLEIVIPTSAIGYTGGAVNVLVDINAGGDSYLSNQFLPGLAVGTGNLGGTTFNFGAAPTPTNRVTFQIDMSAQVLLGNFTNGDPNGKITVSGDFEGWGDGLPLTNNPTLSGNASNIYSAVCPVVSLLPDAINYKFRMNGGWESPTSTSGNNRQVTVTSTNQVLPLVYYNDNSIYDLVASPITVTFTLYMPNGSLDRNGYAFNNASDTLWIDGDFVGWPSGAWPGPVSNFPGSQQMMEVGTSDYYTNSFVIPRGNSVYINYKYAIDSEDDENGVGTNHVREVRSYGPTYSMPTDVWSWSVVQPGVEPYPNPGIASTNIVEPDFGYLAIQSQSGGNYPITWLGRPGVVLQNTTNLTHAVWNTSGGTDGTEVTNWPSAGNGNIQFFRLMKKQ